ncbi:MAG TPA: DinB family protein, partial [Micromonosporaceae bacterium]|nr:DinB family protein [Micromonosporaceae bacterium]
MRSAVEGLGPADLRWTPGPAANPIGWLVWHLTRVQDDHVA